MPAHAVSPCLISPLCEALATFRSDASEHIAWRLLAQPRSRVEMTHVLGNVYETHCQNSPIYSTRAAASHVCMETCLCSLLAMGGNCTLQRASPWDARRWKTSCLSNGQMDLSIGSATQGSRASEGRMLSISSDSPAWLPSSPAQAFLSLEQFSLKRQSHNG